MPSGHGVGAGAGAGSGAGALSDATARGMVATVALEVSQPAETKAPTALSTNSGVALRPTVEAQTEL